MQLQEQKTNYHVLLFSGKPLRYGTYLCHVDLNVFSCYFHNNELLYSIYHESNNGGLSCSPKL